MQTVDSVVQHTCTVLLPQCICLSIPETVGMMSMSGFAFLLPDWRDLELCMSLIGLVIRVPSPPKLQFV